MKILFFSRLFYPHIGGVEKHVEEISKKLLRRGHEVTVLTEKFDKSLQDNEIINGIKIKRIENGIDDWFKKFRVWINIWKNRKLIINADVIHAHDVFFWFLPFKFLFLKKKVFVTFHGYEGNNLPGLKSKLMHKISEKFSSGNICVGDFLKKWYGTKPDYVIYGGVNLPKNTIKPKNKNVIKFLFLGRLEEETGIMEYLKALKILKEKKYIFEITILGDGSLRKETIVFCLHNKIKAEFKGFVRNVDEYIINSDYVFASRYLGILETLALKRFIFAVYNNEIKKDYLNLSPFSHHISVSKSYRKLNEKIEFYQKNKKIKEHKISKGYNWVKDKTWENVTSTCLKLWRNNSI